VKRVLVAHIVENGFLLREESPEGGSIGRQWVALTSEDFSRLVAERVEAVKAERDSRGIDSAR
jgi:hypothetical protein